MWGFHKASNRYENGVVAYVVADASWLSLHLRKYALARHYLLLSLAW